MNFSAKLVKSNVNRLTLNLDFCSKITEDGIEQIVEDFCEKKECLRISFPDREYSPNFIRNCLKIVS